MDAATRLRDGDALHAVRAALVLQTTVCARTVDEKGDLLKAADLRRIAAQDLRPPALPLGIARIHTEKARRKECRFFSSDTAANLNNDVLVIVRIARQEENRQLLCEDIARCFRLCNLLGEHLLHLGIRLGEHFLVLVDGCKCPLIGGIRLDDRRECRVLTRVTLPFFHICHHVGIAEECLQFAVFVRNGIQFA